MTRGLGRRTMWLMTETKSAARRYLLVRSSPAARTRRWHEVPIRIVSAHPPLRPVAGAVER